MKVVDAGVIVELLAGGLDPDRLGAEMIAATSLLITDARLANAPGIGCDVLLL